MMNLISQRRLNFNSFNISFQIKSFTNKAKKALRDHIAAAKVVKKNKILAQETYDFALRDEKENFEYDKKLYYDKSYLKIMNDWKDNMAAKQKAKAIIKERFEHYPKHAPTTEKFVVHDVKKEIVLPANQDQIFAVINFKGFQHKITKDDSIMLDKLDVDIGKIIVFDKVLLVGTPEYTSIGRPFIPTAKVIAVIEQNTQCRKVIIFKKKRRKGYQRNKGHRQQVTVVRILKILHDPEPNTVDNYHKL